MDAGRVGVLVYACAARVVRRARAARRASERGCAHPCLRQLRRTLGEGLGAVLALHRRVEEDVVVDLAELGLEHDRARLEGVEHVQQILAGAHRGVRRGQASVHKALR